MRAVAPISARLPIHVTPSEWAQAKILIPVRSKLIPFSFKRREYLIPFYDGTDPKILLMIARQAEKSTSQGNRMLALSCMIPHFKCLYVSPSQTQTRKFSQDRIAQPLAFSKRLRAEMEPILPNNVHEKVLRNQSSIELRYSNRSADRVRGVAADYLVIDELQDIFIENVPVIEETLAHSDRPDHAAWESFSFTPKSLDNTASYYWDQSTQSELMIPCEHHGTSNAPATWHWITLTERNIGKHGLICEKCGNPINRWHPMRGWVDSVPLHPKTTPFRGYHLPQVLTPGVADDQWESKVLYKYEHFPRPQFFNEVWAIPFESGIRPLSKGEIIACCDPEWMMSRDQLRQALKWHSRREIFLGIDYGTAEYSWTVVALGTYVAPGVFKIFYIHRFMGQESIPEIQMKLTVELYRLYGVKVSFGDYGMGQYGNDVLTRAFGHRKHKTLQYVAEAKRKIYYNPQKVRWIGVRDDLVAAMMNAVKQRKIQFPSWQVFETYGQDFLNITTEFNNARQRTVYSHHPAKPDDSFHACLYCLLASSLVIARPDIFLSVERK